MKIFDRLFGDDDEAQDSSRRRGTTPRASANQLSDEQAVARYRYMLQTAPPEAIEQAHTEAFAKLTPEQRRQVLAELSTVVPPQERAATKDDPQSLARIATRAELRQPGILERTFGGIGGGASGMGFGGMLAGSLLASVAGSFIGSAIAESFFDNDTGFDGGENNFADQSAGQDFNQDAGDEMTADAGSEFDSGDFGGDDFSGDI